MNTERPTINREVAQSLRAVPESLRNVFDDLKPEGFEWDRIEAAMDVLKGEKVAVSPKPPEPEPTESQKFFRDMYRSGQLTPYQKDRPGIELKKIKEAWTHPETQGQTSRIMAVDLAIRGGADKAYNQLGPVGHRAKRMAVMAGTIVPNFFFDVATSIPSAFLIEFAKLKGNKDSKTLQTGLSGLTKVIEVANDKAVTALNDMAVQKLTGEKGGWTHEGPDKLADTLQTALDDRFKDAVNGPVLESASRMLFQLPVIGAVIEQGWTRVSLLQERSPLHKGLAKAIYMGVGVAWGVWREVKNTDKNPKVSPSAQISRWLWRQTAWGKTASAEQ